MRKYWKKRCVVCMVEKIFESMLKLNIQGLVTLEVNFTHKNGCKHAHQINRKHNA